MQNNLKNYIQISPLCSYVDGHFATLKVLICIHFCHTTYTFFLALNPLKMFRINKKGDQFRLLGNCPPTPPLSHHFALNETTVLMLA